MKPYKTILLATDLSERSADLGARLAMLVNATGARPHLVHVLEHVPENFPADVVPSEGLDKMDIMRDRAREGLESLAYKSGLGEVQVSVCVGKARDEILRVAQEQHVDLVVVGAHERHGLALLRGSVADGVLHGAFCDVLAVHLPR